MSPRTEPALYLVIPDTQALVIVGDRVRALDGTPLQAHAGIPADPWDDGITGEYPIRVCHVESPEGEVQGLTGRGVAARSWLVTRSEPGHSLFADHGENADALIRQAMQPFTRAPRPAVAQLLELSRGLTATGYPRPYPPPALNENWGYGFSSAYNAFFAVTRAAVERHLPPSDSGSGFETLVFQVIGWALGHKRPNMALRCAVDLIRSDAIPSVDGNVLSAYHRGVVVGRTTVAVKDLSAPSSPHDGV